MLLVSSVATILATVPGPRVRQFEIATGRGGYKIGGADGVLWRSPSIFRRSVQAFHSAPHDTLCEKMRYLPPGSSGIVTGVAVLFSGEIKMSPQRSRIIRFDDFLSL
jgi:hypothetical protein